MNTKSLVLVAAMLIAAAALAPGQAPKVSVQSVTTKVVTRLKDDLEAKRLQVAMSLESALLSMPLYRRQILDWQDASEDHSIQKILVVSRKTREKMLEAGEKDFLPWRVEQTKNLILMIPNAPKRFHRLKSLLHSGSNKNKVPWLKVQNLIFRGPINRLHNKVLQRTSRAGNRGGNRINRKIAGAFPVIVICQIRRRR